jgi:hypothetical protein
MFVTWEILEGETFPNIEPFEPLTTKFTMLWYSSNMGKQWQSNAIFHIYYLQLKRDIEDEPRMTPNTPEEKEGFSQETLFPEEIESHFGEDAHCSHYR